MPTRRSNDTSALGAMGGRLRYKGKYREAVERSLITLNALIYRPDRRCRRSCHHVLARAFGGVRNWDYRYCWLRDTTFTLLALTNGGYYDEAAAWQDWLLRALAGSPEQVQIMYGLKGERQLMEWEIDLALRLRKFAARARRQRSLEQLQLDIYGEMLAASFTRSKAWAGTAKTSFRMLRAMVEHLETIWQQPDEGIWETRGGPQHFTYSKMMAWVAFDRAVGGRAVA